MENSEQEKITEAIPATQLGLHSVRNLLGNEQQLSLFSEHKTAEFAKDYGIQIERAISRYGIDLTDLQQRILEALLYGLSKTKYEGNIEPRNKEQHAKEKYASGKLPSAYKYIKHFPRLRVTQAEILSWAGINKNSAGDVQNATKAIKYLSTTQYCFFYNRLALDENGTPLKDKDGFWKKESVEGVDTLFTISEVRDEKTHTLKYYEVIPSALFLDQRESYFMLIPYNWREEVRKLIGQKKSSSYTFRFLLFLRYQFELKRRSGKEKKPYVIKWSPEEIAVAIKMPESTYKRKKSQAHKILEEIYRIARQLGYLSSYERTDSLDVLILNEKKYYAPRNQEAIHYDETVETSPEMVQAEELYNLIIQEKRKLDPRYSPPAGGSIQKSSLKHLLELIKERSFEEVKQVFMWGIVRSYWCNRIGAPLKLRTHFNEALSEMKAMQKSSSATSEEKEQKNKAFVEELVKKLEGRKGLKGKIEVLNKYVEIGDGIHNPVCIKYTENGFQEQLEGALRKWGLPIS